MVTLRPTARVALLLGVLAVLLGLGELVRALVPLALALDGAVAAAWMIDVVLRGRLGLVERSQP